MAKDFPTMVKESSEYTRQPKEKVYPSKEAYAEEAKRRAHFNRVERIAKARLIREEQLARARRSRELKAQARGFTSAVKKATGAVKVEASRAKRAYRKSANWYKTRVAPSGGYRNPQQFEGMDSDQTETQQAGVGGQRFNLGGVAGYDRNITGVGTHEQLEMGFASPLENNDRSQFEGSSKLLQVSNNQSNLLNLSNTSNGKKREIKWF